MNHINRIAVLFQESRPFLNAVGDSTRQKLLSTMMSGEILSVKELASQTNLSRPTISHHLKILKEAHIIVEQKKGRQIFYRPQAGEYFYIVKELIDTIDQVLKKEGC